MTVSRSAQRINKSLYLLADLAYKLAEIVGFNFTIKPVWDNDHGKSIGNGTWTGMIGELITRVRVIINKNIIEIKI